MSKTNLELTPKQIDFLMSPVAIRERAAQIFALTESGQGAFAYHAERLDWTVDYVLTVIRRNYPDLKIPFHSRWRHFRAGQVDRVVDLDSQLKSLEPLERARVKLDLVITSVLLDAGAGTKWTFKEAATGKVFGRSEGLGLASLYMFRAGAFSHDGKSLRADREGLSQISVDSLSKGFQVGADNPLAGLDGRVLLLNNLAGALGNRALFRDGRPGNILDLLIDRHGQSIPARGILAAVLEGLGPIWPGRLTALHRNLGDVWRHSRLGDGDIFESLVPFHKLSQWLTYSLIEPILEAGLQVTGVEELTGLAEYRNGGLMLDSGLLSLRQPADAARAWRPESNLIIEWRALTIYLLDLIGARVQNQLGRSPQEFPLAKVLEGGTWWAGRYLAQEKRADGTPPLQIHSDGTVF